MPTPSQQRRRALELLEASIDGCTEAIMLAYGFKTELVVCRNNLRPRSRPNRLDRGMLPSENGQRFLTAHRPAC
jgi:hypothetical protein